MAQPSNPLNEFLGRLGAALDEYVAEVEATAVSCHRELREGGYVGFFTRDDLIELVNTVVHDGSARVDAWLEDRA